MDIIYLLDIQLPELGYKPFKRISFYDWMEFEVDLGNIVLTAAEHPHALSEHILCCTSKIIAFEQELR